MDSIFKNCRRTLVRAAYKGIDDFRARLRSCPPELHDEVEALRAASEQSPHDVARLLNTLSRGCLLWLMEAVAGVEPWEVVVNGLDGVELVPPEELLRIQERARAEYPGIRLPPVPTVSEDIFPEPYHVDPYRIHLYLIDLDGPPDVVARRATELRALALAVARTDRIIDAALRHRVRAARRRAAEIGLAYWPALAYGPRIDPRAYLVAEEEFAAAGEGRWGEGDCHGGWDTQEVWGASAHQVAEMWRSAGCRDSYKYRLMLRAHIEDRDKYGHVRSRPLIFGPRWGLKRCHDWLRGKRWAERYELSVSSGVARTLGRLPPRLRWAAVAHASRRGGRIRARDLDWDAVRAVRDAWRQEGAGALRVRAAAAPSCERAAYVLGCSSRQVASLLAPAFPTLSFDHARLIAMGHSPRDLVPAGIGLTAREAHEWCLDGAPDDVVAWYAEYHRLPTHRSMRVLRWMLALRQSGRWGTLCRPRRMYRPDGACEVRLIDIIDEVDEADIVSGSDSAARVMGRVEARLKDARTSHAFCDHRPLAPLPAWACTLPRWVRLLRTPAALASEGEEMEHCVGSYAGAVERGECHILSVRSIHGRSTVELTPHMEVAQHKGVANSEPPRRHDQLLRAWLRRVRAHNAVARAA